MKKILFFLTMMIGFLAANAQTPEEADVKQQEKIQSLYVAFITQKLELSSAEAQVFWPVHNEFDKEVKAVNMNLPELEREQKILDIKKRYEPRFNKILLNPKRVDKLFRLNGEFRKKLVERISRQRANQQRPKLRRGI
ncbi:hypothetical protein [Ferruginibacter sp.]|jgi:hypothetical protein